MSNPMNYRGQHRKYAENSSDYVVYYYGDVVERAGISYVCGVERTSGYLPEESSSGFIVLGDQLGGSSAGVDGGSYT